MQENNESIEYISFLIKKSLHVLCDGLCMWCYRKSPLNWTLECTSFILLQYYSSQYMTLSTWMKTYLYISLCNITDICSTPTISLMTNITCLQAVYCNILVLDNKNYFLVMRYLSIISCSFLRASFQVSVQLLI